MTRLILYILILETVVSFGQISCDNKTISDFEKKFYKADKRDKSDEYKYADVTFDIAECYRQKNDTSYLKWYRTNLRVSKSSMKGCDKDIMRSTKLFSQMGYSAFYLGQYKEATNYFQKAASHRDNSIYNYMLGLSEMHLEHYEIAIIEFNNFKKTAVDLKDVDKLLSACKDKINSKQ